MSKNKGFAMFWVLILFFVLLMIFQPFSDNLINLTAQVEKIYQDESDTAFIEMIFLAVESAIDSELASIHNMNQFDTSSIETTYGVDITEVSEMEYLIELTYGTKVFFESFNIYEGTPIIDFSVASKQDILLNGGINITGDVYSDNDFMHASISPFYDQGYSSTGTISYDDVNAVRNLSCSSGACYESFSGSPTNVLKDNFVLVEEDYTEFPVFTFDLFNYTSGIVEAVTEQTFYSINDGNDYFEDNYYSFSEYCSISDFNGRRNPCGNQRRAARLNSDTYIGNTYGSLPDITFMYGIDGNSNNLIVINANVTIPDGYSSSLRGNIIIVGDLDIEGDDVYLEGNIVVFGDVNFRAHQTRIDSYDFTLASFNDIRISNDLESYNTYNPDTYDAFFYALGNIEVSLYYQSCWWILCSTYSSEFDLDGGLYAEGNEDNFSDILNTKGVEINSLNGLFSMSDQTSTNIRNRSMLNSAGGFSATYSELDSRDI